MHKIFNKIEILLTSLALLLTGANFVSADSYGLGDTAQKAFGDTTQTLPGMLGKIIGAGLSLIGILFLILMIYGGFLWMFSRGNDADTKKAKDLISAAIVGLIIVLSAYAITAWLGNELMR